MNDECKHEWVDGDDAKCDECKFICELGREECPYISEGMFCKKCGILKSDADAEPKRTGGFTTGKWKKREECFIKFTRTLIVDENGKTVAVIDPTMCDSGTGTNSDLIAAAPEMYGLIARHVELTNEMEKASYNDAMEIGNELTEVLEKMKSILKKANGVA